jgi:hypothetical protein
MGYVVFNYELFQDCTSNIDTRVEMHRLLCASRIVYVHTE